MRREDVAAALAAADNWHKSSFSGGDNGGCVAVGTVPGFVGVRDTKIGSAGPVIAFTDRRWAEFLSAVRAGEFGR